MLTTALTYEEIITFTHQPIFIILTLVISLFPLFLYLLIASLTHARTADGRKLSHRMIGSANAWIPVVIWVFVQGGLFILFYFFPFWAGLLQ